MIRSFTLFIICSSTLTFSSECGAQTVQSPLVVKSANRIAKDLLQIVPNPGSGIYSVVFRSEYKGPVSIAVSDAIGRYVYLKTIKEFSGELKESIDISGNPRGIYILEVETDVNRESKKVIYQ